MDDQKRDTPEAQNNRDSQDPPFARDTERGEDQDVAKAESHGFEEAQADNPALRFASSRTEGGSDQFTAKAEDDAGEEHQPTSGVDTNPL